jgi:predicted DNA-binding helix-hairpin-helix protein
MSRTWTRTQTATICGYCHTYLPTGRTVQLVSVLGVKRASVRCEACADGPAPPDLPAVVLLGRSTKRMTQLSRSLPADFKMAQAGREPGED